jgi:high-affinity nickel-transport protein
MQPQGVTVVRAALPGIGAHAPSLRSERGALFGLFGAVAFLHVLGIGLLLYYGHAHPSLLGLGIAAYMLGLRHAFDADHIAAIDDTVRLMLQKGRRPLGVGLFFSLGHSTIVLVLAVALALAASWVAAKLPAMQHYGGLIGASVSGVFLWVIGLLNLRVLLDLLDVWRRARTRAHDHDHMEQLLARRGFMNRLFRGRLQDFIRSSWHMYPLGLLFGLGFDTASEVALLAMTAGAAGGSLPLSAVMALPLLFAAGMSLMDTTDGVLMTRAYQWALVNPLRKLFYNLGTTSLSVIVALAIGSIELLQVFIETSGARGPWLDRIAALDFGALGYVVVALFLLSWALSALLWKCGPGRREAVAVTQPHAHDHLHADGTRHRHPHVH